jgi:hypothetical protein
VSLLENYFDEWKPVSRYAGISWLVFYAAFLLYAFANRPGFLILDNVNLMIHEAGHVFFSWCGYTIMILGGTLGELLAPLLLAVYFFWKLRFLVFRKFSLHRHLYGRRSRGIVAARGFWRARLGNAVRPMGAAYAGSKHRRSHA